MDGAFLAIVAAVLVIAAAVVRATAWSSWALPLLVSSVAALIAAVYQRWWTRASFDGDGDGNGVGDVDGTSRTHALHRVRVQTRRRRRMRVP